MSIENNVIRRSARAAGVPLWRIADGLGVSEATFTRWMRFPLAEEKERAALAIIKRLSQEAENGKS